VKLTTVGDHDSAKEGRGGKEGQRAHVEIVEIARSLEKMPSRNDEPVYRYDTCHYNGETRLDHKV